MQTAKTWIEDRWQEHVRTMTRCGIPVQDEAKFRERMLQVVQCSDGLDALGHSELFALDHAEQYRGCLQCKESHHSTAFCHECGRCYFKAVKFDNTDYGDFVTCQCGHVDMWD